VGAQAVGSRVVSSSHQAAQRFMASSGTQTGVRSPLRSSRASWIASR
jgi:hypothetical protein